MIGFLICLIIAIAIFVAVIFLRRDKGEVQPFNQIVSRSVGPYRDPAQMPKATNLESSIESKPNTTTNLHEDLKKLNFDLAEATKMLLPSQPIMLENGTEWFDRNAVVQSFKSFKNPNFELLLTYKNSWVEKIGDKYYKVEEKQAMKWLLEHCPSEFEKRGGWDKAKEV